MQVYDTLTTAERVTGLSEQLVRFPNGKVLKIGRASPTPNCSPDRPGFLSTRRSNG